jgi:hypothetical protein
LRIITGINKLVTAGTVYHCNSFAKTPVAKVSIRIDTFPVVLCRIGGEFI